MAKIGVLSRNTFFPRTGDVLDDLEDGISYECMKAWKVVDPKTGKVVRVCVLFGRHPDTGDIPIPRVLEDSVMPPPFIDSIDIVHRAKGGVLKAYERNKKGNYEEA